MSTTSSNLTFSAKYQQIVAEYTKLRNQVPLLKKAVLTEQSKNTELLDEQKGKEQRLRKCDAEIESLTFRNQQLTKRVENLQTVIEDMQKLTSGSLNHHRKNSLVKKSKLPNSQSDFSFISNTNDTEKCTILEEELRRKLEENENLHKKIHEAQLETETNRQALQSTIEELQHNLNQCKLELAAISTKHDFVLKTMDEKSENLQQSFHKIQENLHNHHVDSGGLNNLQTQMAASISSARSPETYSFDASGGSNSDAVEDLTNKINGDHTFPDSSNYSSITHSSTALENAERMQEENLMLIEDLKKQLKDKQRQFAELDRQKEKISLDNQLLTLSLKYHRSTSRDDSQLTPDDDWSKYTSEYYGAKLSDLNLRLQQEQSKVVYYDDECRNLLIRLHNAQKCIEEHSAINRALNKNINEVKDEAETTRRNYEAQMRTLSDHLAREISQKPDFQGESKSSHQKRNLFR